MDVEVVKVGYLEENCYILRKNDKCLIIDPGDEGDKIIEAVGESIVVGILVTHSHQDHIGALDEVSSYYNARIYEFNNLEEKRYNVDSFSFEVIFTPGHTSDSVSYYFYRNKIMFVGDFIFREGIGRCDLPTGNIKMMYKSINKIKKYPDIVIFSGHGQTTSLSYEMKNNYYFNS